MTEHTQQIIAQPGAVPTRIQFDEFIEAVARGVVRALAAQDDVGGYLASSGGAGSYPGPLGPTTRPIITVLGGFVPSCPGPQVPGELSTAVQGG
jgi:hypothetical protein